MSVSINYDECIGCGVCMQVCPSRFGLDEDAGKATLMENDHNEDEQIKEAVDCCPFGCINE